MARVNKPHLLGLGLSLLLASNAAFAQVIRCDDPFAMSPGCLRPHELPVVQSNSAPGKFSARLIFLADQLERNVDVKMGTSSYLIGSFVDLNDMSKTSSMGRLIAENLMHEMQVRSWRIFEPRLMQNFMINEGGEFVLSRDVKQLREKFGVSGVIAGTYMSSGEHTIINARVVHIETGMVLSSGQIQIPSNWFTDNLMSEAPSRPMRIVGRP